MAKLLFQLLFVSASIWIVSSYQRIKLPNDKDLLDQIFRDPYQRMVSESSFDFNYRKSVYTVKPVADYQLWGLVISHNNINAFSDIYHTKDSVDIKDICVLWGENLNQVVFNNFQFWSEPWTCWAQTKSDEAMSRFNMDQLSNNHLLSDNPKIRKKILEAKIGDQIYLSGKLINYYPKGMPDISRNSSTVRDDTGNGACEVIFVDDFQILRLGNVTWSKVYNISKLISYILLVLSPLYWLFSIYYEDHKRYKHLKNVEM